MEGPDTSTLYSRSKVAKGESHPLKRTEIDAEIAARPRLDVTWVALSRNDARSAARYFARWPPARRPALPSESWLPLCSGTWVATDPPVPFPGHACSAWLTVYAVASSRRQELRHVLLETALPAVLDWAEAIAVGPETGWMKRRECAAGFAGDALHVVRLD